METVVISGGSSGIGFDLSMEAFSQGAHVSIIARNKAIKIFLFLNKISFK